MPSTDDTTGSPAAPDAPALLRIPERFRTVADVLGAAAKLGLDNIVILAERDNGALVLLCDGDSTIAQVNYRLDRLKFILVQPSREPEESD